MSTIDKVAENALRRRAKRLGVILIKSRARLWSIDNQQGYRIVDSREGNLLSGEKFDLDPDQVASFLSEYEIQLRQAIEQKG